MIRDQFRTMPPKRHDRLPERSQVLAHIMATRGCDLEQAISTFHYLRRRGHLRFQKAGRLWMGVEHIPDESEAQFRGRMAAEVAALQAKVSRLEDLLERIKQAHNQVCDHLGL